MYRLYGVFVTPAPFVMSKNTSFASNASPYV